MTPNGLRERGLAFAQRTSDAQRRLRPPTAQVIEVIEVVFLRGAGVETDPVRQVTGYYAFDGTLLAESDPAPATNEPEQERESAADYFGSKVCGVTVCNWSGPTEEFDTHPHRSW